LINFERVFTTSKLVDSTTERQQCGQTTNPGLWEFLLKWNFPHNSKFLGPDLDSAPMWRKGMAIALLVVILLVSGCSMLDSGSQSEDRPSVVRGISVSNEDNQSHTVDIVVLHNDTVVYWTTRTIEGRMEHMGTTVVDSAIVRPQIIENSTRTYTVLIRLDNNTQGVRYSMENYDFPKCTSLGAEIRDGEVLGPMISHWPDDKCEYPWTRTTYA